MPMAWLEAAAVAADMVRSRRWCAAVCLLLMFDLYLRLGEAFPLQVKSAAPPMIEGGKSTQFRSFTIRADEEGVAPKVGNFDGTVVLDHPRWCFLGELVAALRTGRAGRAPLFPGADALSFNTAFRKSCQRLGLELVPYQARHGGASAGRAEKFRSLEEVRKRKRWHTESSTRRHEKHGKLQAKLAALPAPLLSHMVYIDESLEDIMRLKKSVPVPPELRLRRDP